MKGLRYTCIICTSLFDWCVARWGTKGKHCKDTWLQEIGLWPRIFSTTPTQQWTQRRGPMYSFKESTNMHFYNPTTKSREVQFFKWCSFIIHHTFDNSNQFQDIIIWSIEGREQEKRGTKHPHTSVAMNRYPWIISDKYLAHTRNSVGGFPSTAPNQWDVFHLNTRFMSCIQWSAHTKLQYITSNELTTSRTKPVTTTIKF